MQLQHFPQIVRLRLYFFKINSVINSWTSSLSRYLYTHSKVQYCGIIKTWNKQEVYIWNYIFRGGYIIVTFILLVSQLNTSKYFTHKRNLQGLRGNRYPTFWTGVRPTFQDIRTQVKNLLPTEATCGHKITLKPFSAGAAPPEPTKGAHDAPPHLLPISMFFSSWIGTPTF